MNRLGKYDILRGTRHRTHEDALPGALPVQCGSTVRRLDSTMFDCQVIHP
jgi:hypothetical protein